MKLLLTDKIFLKLLIFYIIGIISIEYGGWLFLSIAGLASVIGYLFVRWYLGVYLTWYSLGLVLSFTMLGAAIHYWTYISAINHDKLAIAQWVGREHTMLYRIEEPPEARPTSTKLRGTLISIKDSIKSASPNVGMILYLDPKIDAENYDIGQIIRIRAKIDYPLPPLNPFEYNYSQYLYRNGYVATAYCRQADSFGYDTNIWRQISYFPIRLRNFFSNQIARYISEPQTAAIAQSILIGVRSHIDPELYRAYSSTGTIHILSVSGVHFAIFFWVVSIVVGWILPDRWLVAKFTVQQSLAFGYALITGFSPPVFRSFLMLFFVDLQRVTKSRGSMFNTFFLSALIILTIDSTQLFDIGFQLSYFTLFGLIALHYPIYSIFEIPNRWVAKVYSMTVGLVVAWIFSLPLTMYYFHKFSFSGMLVNYLIIPLSEIGLQIGFMFIALCGLRIEWINISVGFVLEQMFKLQNWLILFFEKLPYSFIDRIYISHYELGGLIIAVLLLAYFVYTRSRQALLAIAMLMILWSGYRIFYHYSVYHESHWVMFRLRKYTAFGYKINNRLILFSDSIDSKTFDFSIYPYICYYQIDSIKRVPLRSYLKGTKMLLSANPIVESQYFVMAKENKDIWKSLNLLSQRVILSHNMGDYYRDKYSKQYPNAIVVSDTSPALIFYPK